LKTAVKYVHERFGAEKGGRIDISLQPGDGRYFLLVRDNGVGVTEESAAPNLRALQQRGLARAPAGGGARADTDSDSRSQSAS
jgi:signal transduction histidine kinase